MRKTLAFAGMWGLLGFNAWLALAVGGWLVFLWSLLSGFNYGYFVLGQWLYLRPGSRGYGR